MSKQNNQSELIGNLTGLRQEIKEIADKDKKSLKLWFFIRCGLLAFFILYLGFAYGQFRQVDAESLVDAASVLLVESLPDLQKQANQHLEKIAPDLVNGVSNELLHGLPGLADKVSSVVTEIIGQYNDEFEQNVSKWLADYVRQQREQLADMSPGLSSYDTIVALRNHAMEESTSTITMLASESSTNIDDHPLLGELQHLLTGQNLSKREKMERDIIALWYLLAQRSIDEAIAN